VLEQPCAGRPTISRPAVTSALSPSPRTFDHGFTVVLALLTSDLYLLSIDEDVERGLILTGGCLRTGEVMRLPLCSRLVSRQ
jgi:hypothetical protein